MTTTAFHAYEELPGSGNGDLLSLTARHPSAAVVYSVYGYRAANNRLFPEAWLYRPIVDGRIRRSVQTFQKSLLSGWYVAHSDQLGEHIGG
jgi:hypothetical protein